MIIRVEKLRLSDGSTYTGAYDEREQRPMGSGCRTYSDGHEAMGTFLGEPNGVSYINCGTYMLLGCFTQGYLQGWGMQMGNGDYRFGIYNRGVLIHDCTYLIEETHEHITSISRKLRAQGINVRWGHHYLNNDEVFFGVMVKGYKKVGIRFFPSGDVYIGTSPYTLDITGWFVHLKDTFVESGQFEQGSLVFESKHCLAHSESWIELLLTKQLSFNDQDERAFEISRITRNVLNF